MDAQVQRVLDAATISLDEEQRATLISKLIDTLSYPCLFDHLTKEQIGQLLPQLVSYVIKEFIHGSNL